MSDRTIEMLLAAIVVFNAAMTALNIVMYVIHGEAISLGAAVFCGCMFVWSLVNATRA
jgi:hypothetical protein